MHCTSASDTGLGAVGDDDVASCHDASATWVAVSRTESDPPTASQSITGLTNGTAYRVRVRAKNTADEGSWVRDTGTPKAALVECLSVSPKPVNEGNNVDVTITLSGTAPSDISIPVTVTAGTAESGDCAVNDSSVVFFSGIAQSTSHDMVTTNQDADLDDETFTMALGTLPSGYTAGSDGRPVIVGQNRADRAGPVEDGGDLLVVQFPHVRQANAPMNPVERPRPEYTLKVLDSAAHGRLRRVKFLAGGAETAEPASAFERTQ